MRFSRTEINHIAVALFVITIALTLYFFGFPSVFGFIGGFLVMLLTFGIAFIAHELAHKYVAQKYGFWAEFRYWETGLLLGLLMGISRAFLFLAPGAVYISAYNISKRQNAYISLAGAATNFTLALIFFLLSPLFGSISEFAIEINLLLAIFNLLPIPPLDGSKVFAWAPKNWALIFFGLILARAIML
jgi:Zn-dependent protease